MATISNAGIAREAALQRVLTVWIVTGVAFMLLPGTFLGVWNLISITGEHTAARIDPAWIQAHGHAQIFGWIGSFILGIGFYSLAKTARSAAARAWMSWGLWTAGVTARWAVNLWGWQWQAVLPASALLELAGFLIFFITVLGHRPTSTRASQGASPRPAWMAVVVAGTLGFLLSVLVNLAAAIQSTLAGAGPAVPHTLDQRLLAIFTWAFPVVVIWGFSARWLPVFLGLAAPADRQLVSAVAVNTTATLAAAAGLWTPATLLFLAGAAIAAGAIHVFLPSIQSPKVTGIHPSFPAFVRIAYGWLIASAALSVAAAQWDRTGGVWGASRHALTVGFISTMVFAIGQRVLPAFCGMRLLFSPALMFASMALLNAGCLLRVVSEICAYESYVPALWPLLPVSALVEMAAVTLFAANLLLTLHQEPPHLRSLRPQ